MFSAILKPEQRPCLYSFFVNRKEYNRYHLENRLLFRVHAAQEEIKRRQRQRGERKQQQLGTLLSGLTVTAATSTVTQMRAETSATGKTASEDSDGDDDFR